MLRKDLITCQQAAQILGRSPSNISRALAQGLAEETELAAEFDADDQAVLINSLSCRPIGSHNGQPMATTIAAVDLWQSLLP